MTCSAVSPGCYGWFLSSLEIDCLPFYNLGLIYFQSKVNYIGESLALLHVLVGFPHVILALPRIHCFVKFDFSYGLTGILEVVDSSMIMTFEHKLDQIYQVALP